MSLFDVIKYQVDVPPTLEQLDSLPVKLKLDYWDLVHETFADGRAPTKEDQARECQMIADTLRKWIRDLE